MHVNWCWEWAESSVESFDLCDPKQNLTMLEKESYQISSWDTGTELHSSTSIYLPNYLLRRAESWETRPSLNMRWNISQFLSWLQGVLIKWFITLWLSLCFFLSESMAFVTSYWLHAGEGMVDCAQEWVMPPTEGSLAERDQITWKG